MDLRCRLHDLSCVSGDILNHIKILKNKSTPDVLNKIKCKVDEFDEIFKSILTHLNTEIVSNNVYNELNVSSKIENDENIKKNHEERFDSEIERVIKKIKILGKRITESNVFLCDDILSQKLNFKNRVQSQMESYNIKVRNLEQQKMKIISTLRDVEKSICKEGEQRIELERSLIDTKYSMVLLEKDIAKKQIKEKIQEGKSVYNADIIKSTSESNSTLQVYDGKMSYFFEEEEHLNDLIEESRKRLSKINDDIKYYEMKLKNNREDVYKQREALIEDKKRVLMQKIDNVKNDIDRYSTELEKMNKKNNTSMLEAKYNQLVLDRDLMISYAKKEKLCILFREISNLIDKIDDTKRRVYNNELQLCIESRQTISANMESLNAKYYEYHADLMSIIDDIERQREAFMHNFENSHQFEDLWTKIRREVYHYTFFFESVYKSIGFTGRTRMLNHHMPYFQLRKKSEIIHAKSSSYVKGYQTQVNKLKEEFLSLSSSVNDLQNEITSSDRVYNLIVHFVEVELEKIRLKLSSLNDEKVAYHEKNIDTGILDFLMEQNFNQLIKLMSLLDSHRASIHKLLYNQIKSRNEHFPLYHFAAKQLDNANTFVLKKNEYDNKLISDAQQYYKSEQEDYKHHLMLHHSRHIEQVRNFCNIETFTSSFYCQNLIKLIVEEERLYEDIRRRETVKQKSIFMSKLPDLRSPNDM